MIDEVSTGDFRPDQPRGQQLSSELASSSEPPGEELDSTESEGSEDKKTLIIRGMRHVSPRLSRGTVRSTCRSLTLHASSSGIASQGLYILRPTRVGPT